MRKIILLLLSVLAVSLASVSAEEVVIHTSNSNDELYDFISDWNTYNNCNFAVENGNIVFSSYDDFLNFFTPKIQDNLPHLDNVSVEIDGKTYPLTVVNIQKDFGGTNSAEHRFVLSTGEMVINSVIHTSSWSKIQVFGNGVLECEHTGDSYGVVSFDFNGGSIAIIEEDGDNYELVEQGRYYRGIRCSPPDPRTGKGHHCLDSSQGNGSPLFYFPKKGGEYCSGGSCYLLVTCPDKGTLYYITC